MPQFFEGLHNFKSTLMYHHLTDDRRYLIADYERSQFSINQCRLVEGLPVNVQAISSRNSPNVADDFGSHATRSTDGLSPGIASVIVMVPILILAVLGVILTRFRRGKQRAAKQTDGDDQAAAAVVAASISGEHVLHEEQIPPPELHNIAKCPLELGGVTAAVEISSGAPTLHELE